MAADKQPVVLDVQDLRTYFSTDEGIVKAVDGASFAVASGRTVGMVGESGCGKSVTAFSILRVVDKPGKIVHGRILFHPQRGATAEPLDLAALPEEGAVIRSIRGREIGLVFQEPMTSFSPVHTIGDQIMRVVMLHQRVGKKQARERAVEALHRVGIPRAQERVDAYAFQLSGGLRQRAMIAMALVCDPVLLIADEPTTALDVTTQAQILDLLRALQAERGMAIMLITHNLGVVAEMADRVVVMYLGRVVEKGTASEIFHRPQHPYTRALLKSMPSIQAPSRIPLPTITGSIPHPYNRPLGCPFHPRCPTRKVGRCDREEPVLVPASDGHEVACFLM